MQESAQYSAGSFIRPPGGAADTRTRTRLHSCERWERVRGLGGCRDGFYQATIFRDVSSIISKVGMKYVEKD